MHVCIIHRSTRLILEKGKFLCSLDALRDTDSDSDSDKVAGNGTALDRKVYSGERVLLGVATMHKSNMVPIFADKKEDAKDIAQMRRS